MDKVKVGVVGCGNISDVYFKTCKIFDILDVAACADLVAEKARESADKHGIGIACTPDELFSNPEIEMVVNLTVPKAHAEISLAALNAGKHVYGEKPLAVSREDGKRILALADEKGLLVGCAPDTFLGGAHQTCRKLIDDGVIGEPVGATAFFMCPGHERWHPSPEFYYEVGGGPMFDMGPYYLTALINMLGPIASISGLAKTTHAERTITSEPKKGQKIKVETPTHVSGLMDFANGAQATIITSFDVWGNNLPGIEVYGTKGSLSVPDPNYFSGKVRVLKAGEEEWSVVPHTHGHSEWQRGLGPADMAHAIRSGRKHRATGQLAYHVLDAMHSFLDAAETSSVVEVQSTCERPAPFPEDLPANVLD